jgi:proline dehydrogenase
VLQAYLRRTESDCRALAGPGSRVRLCKGAYDEPATVAFRDRAAVDESYRRCLRTLMAGQGYPMVATHDPALIELAVELAADRGPGRAHPRTSDDQLNHTQESIPADLSEVELITAEGKSERGGYELRMLHGVRPAAQRELAAAGHTLRVYLPYGSAWYPYFMRRLGERPANLAFFLRSFTSRS